MSKESLEKAYREVAKAERGALQSASEILKEASDSLQKEIDKLPQGYATVMGGNPLTLLVSAKAQVDTQHQALQGTLSQYRRDDDDAPAPAPPVS